MDEILKLIVATLQLLTLQPSKDREKRRNIKRAWKNYKKIRRHLKKQGLTVEEKEQLDIMMDALIEAQQNFLK